MEEEPQFAKAEVIISAGWASCPCCEHTIDNIEIYETDHGGFEVPVELRFDRCPNCDALIELDGCWTRAGAAP